MKGSSPKTRRYVALWRGINVGKAKRLAMADLRELLSSLGYTRVETLLNSGNAVFDGPAEDPVKVAGKLRAAVAARLHVDALVIVKSAEDIAGCIAGNSLGSVASDPSRLLVAFCPGAAELAKLEAMARGRLGRGAGAARPACRLPVVRQRHPREQGGGGPDAPPGRWRHHAQLGHAAEDRRAHAPVRRATAHHLRIRRSSRM
jgi:uncharacterized protein (DUF1697 family)